MSGLRYTSRTCYGGTSKSHKFCGYSVLYWITPQITYLSLDACVWGTVAGL